MNYEPIGIAIATAISDDEMDMVRRIARKHYFNKIHTWLEYEDLFQAGICGLLAAKRNLNSDTFDNIQQRVYVLAKIYGAIKEEIRQTQRKCSIWTDVGYAQAVQYDIEVVQIQKTKSKENNWQSELDLKIELDKFVDVLNTRVNAYERATLIAWALGVDAEKGVYRNIPSIDTLRKMLRIPGKIGKQKRKSMASMSGIVKMQILKMRKMLGVEVNEKNIKGLK